jgi:hypothetical protein
MKILQRVSPFNLLLCKNRPTGTCFEVSQRPLFSIAAPLNLGPVDITCQISSRSGPALSHITSASLVTAFHFVQDFYNLEGNDPFGNRARFFYGPMMQGRDGVGSCPCVGTGVIFRREALISMGGQVRLGKGELGSVRQNVRVSIGKEAKTPETGSD